MEQETVSICNESLAKTDSGYGCEIYTNFKLKQMNIIFYSIN